jgi:hypothetical protein
MSSVRIIRQYTAPVDRVVNLLTQNLKCLYIAGLNAAME